MSDSTPPRPKPGSLRDRIAAFEQKPAANAAPAPAPRPKPGGLSKWTPKPADPPSPTSASAPVRNVEGGMNASDAKSSIGQGGSLKERMAALQGLGAFGGGAPPADKPRPPTEKPKWKPPPQVQMSPPIGDDGEETPPKPFLPPVHAPGEEIASQPAAMGDPEEAQPTSAPEGEAGEAGELDPEEEERQRRAAIAARMARLGGARVGMGPPVFGKKPVPPPKKPSMDDTKPAEKTEEKAVDEVPPVRVSMDDTPSSSSEPHPGASTDNLSLASNSSSPPTSMPIPAAPKRAGPPRRKTATKSPSPAPPSEEPVSTPPAPAPEPVLSEDAIHKSPEPVDTTESSVSEAQLAKEEGAMSGDTEKEIGGVIQSADEVKEDAPEPIKERPLSSSSDLRPESPVTSPDIKPAEPIIESAVPSVTRLPDPEPATHVDEPEEAAVEREEPAPVIQEEEEDEETRRKRIAERVAKMGGFNPFTAPPPPEATSTEPEEIESPTIPQRKSSVASVGSTSFPSRKESMGSVYSSSVPERKDSAFFAPPQHEEEVEAERPPMPVRKESLNVVPQRQASIDIASPTQLSVPSPPVLARKDSSSSMQSYTVTQIGGGRKVADDEEDGDEGDY